MREIETDPDRAVATLRAWAAEFPRRPIVAVFFAATDADPAEWAFQQAGRGSFLAVPDVIVEHLQSSGALTIGRSAVDGTWRAVPKPPLRPPV